MKYDDTSSKRGDTQMKATHVHHTKASLIFWEKRHAK